MPRNRHLDFEAFLADHPVFSLGELALARLERESTGAARNQVKYHLKTGRLAHAAKGIYAAVPPGIDPAAFKPDRYLVAAAAQPDGVFAYHAALELLGVGHSVWSECTLHCPAPREPIDLGGVRLLFLPTPEPLARAGLHELGLRRVAHEGRRLRVTGPERTLVEGFRRPRRVGGLMELLKAAAGLAVLDFQLLETVLLAYDQRSLWAAVGWLTENEASRWSTPPEFIETCRAHRPRGRQRLARQEREGVLLAEWNLVLPTSVVTGPEGERAPIA